MADTYLSTILRNVLVPPGTPITPIQAFVTAMTVNAAFDSNGLDFSDSGIVTIDPTYLQNQAGITGVSGNEFNCSGNAITDYGNLDSILGALNAAGVSGAVIDVSGGTTVSPISGFVAAEFTIIIPASPVGDPTAVIQWGVCTNGSLLLSFFFDPTVPLSGSGTVVNNATAIGIQDAPTPAQMVAYIQSVLVPYNGGNWGGYSTIVFNSDGTMDNADTNSADLPMVFNDTGTGVTITGTLGSPGTPSANLTELLSNGNTVYYN